MKNDLEMDKQQGSVVREPTSFQVAGTILDKDIESLTEAMIEAARITEEAFRSYAERMRGVMEDIGKSELLNGLTLKTNYWIKYQTSNWPIRWYWKKKYHKACRECQFWEEYNSQFIS